MFSAQSARIEVRINLVLFKHRLDLIHRHQHFGALCACSLFLALMENWCNLKPPLLLFSAQHCICVSGADRGIVQHSPFLMHAT